MLKRCSANKGKQNCMILVGIGKQVNINGLFGSFLFPTEIM